MLRGILNALGGRLVVGFIRLRLALPDRAAEGMARVAGRLAVAAVPSRRRIALRNVGRAFPEMGPGERVALIRRAAELAAVSFSDLLRLFRQPRDEFLAGLDVEGRGHLDAALAGGRGVIAVSAHLGAFPMLAAALPGLGVPLDLLYRRPRSAVLGAEFDRWLARAGCGVIEDRPRHLAAVRCLRSLAAGRCVAILVDQHFAAGETVSFFGHPARTGVGAALLAARSGAPLVPMRILRTGTGRYRLIVEPPVPGPERRDRDSLRRCLERLTARVEAWIRETPEAWFWVHRRWKDLDRLDEAAT
jgi:KDO2-lipid IV(A) lauroyltransferase